MPANLPPQYFEAEQRYREARTPEEKIEALEEMMAIMPKHKGTDKLRAELRRRLSKHKEQGSEKKGPGKAKTAFSIDREGAAQVVIAGPPNTGKSSLIALMTNASPEIADFPHTTHKPTPGMAPYENIQFQLVDTPPLTRDYIDPLLADLMRRADIMALLIDLHEDPLQQYEETLDILASLRIFPEGLPVPENLIKIPFIKKTIILVNKLDEKKDLEDFETFIELAEMKLPVLGISVRKGKNLSAFLERLYDMSGINRVYTKSPGKDPDMMAPFVVPRGTTLQELAEKIHKDFLSRLKYAKVWGKSVHSGQMVQRDYILQDGDVVEIHL
jgi:ribosome-interacting GTPase 1